MPGARGRVLATNYRPNSPLTSGRDRPIDAPLFAAPIPFATSATSRHFDSLALSLKRRVDQPTVEKLPQLARTTLSLPPAADLHGEDVHCAALSGAGSPTSGFIETIAISVAFAVMGYAGCRSKQRAGTIDARGDQLWSEPHCAAQLYVFVKSTCKRASCPIWQPFHEKVNRTFTSIGDVVVRRAMRRVRPGSDAISSLRHLGTPTYEFWPDAEWRRATCAQSDGRRKGTAYQVGARIHECTVGSKRFTSCVRVSFQVPSACLPGLPPLSSAGRASRRTRQAIFGVWRFGKSCLPADAGIMRTSAKPGSWQSNT